MDRFLEQKYVLMCNCLIDLFVPQISKLSQSFIVAKTIALSKLKTKLNLKLKSHPKSSKKVVHFLI